MDISEGNLKRIFNGIFQILPFLLAESQVGLPKCHYGMDFIRDTIVKPKHIAAKLLLQSRDHTKIYFNWTWGQRFVHTYIYTVVLLKAIP